NLRSANSLGFALVSYQVGTSHCLIHPTQESRRTRAVAAGQPGIKITWMLRGRASWRLERWKMVLAGFSLHNLLDLDRPLGPPPYTGTFLRGRKLRLAAHIFG